MTDQYFDGFDRLGEQIFYHKPRPPIAPDTEQPDLIILCPWLYALPKHISKYSAVYQRLFPSVPILMLKQDGPDMIWRPNSWQLENLRPAVSVIRTIEETTNRKLKVLMHIWSNGGSFTACQLADAYASAVQGRLPLTALIIDSAPSVVDMRSGFVALSQGLPASWPKPVKLLGGGVLYSLMIGSTWVTSLFGVEGVITGMRRKLNEPSGPFMAEGVRRVYIYSETDELVPWQHVEAHAREARDVVDKIGGSSQETIKLEKFVGSRHVGHLMVDPERYWKIVQTSWRDTARAIDK